MHIYKNTFGYLTCDLFDEDNIKIINKWYKDARIPLRYVIIGDAVFEHFLGAEFEIKHCGECYRSSNS